MSKESWNTSLWILRYLISVQPAARNVFFKISKTYSVAYTVAEIIFIIDLIMNIEMKRRVVQLWNICLLILRESSRILQSFETQNWRPILLIRCIVNYMQWCNCLCSASWKHRWISSFFPKLIFRWSNNFLKILPLFLRISIIYVTLGHFFGLQTTTSQSNYFLASF